MIVDVTEVNTAPIVTSLLKAQTVDEDATLSVTGIKVEDDSSDTMVDITVGASHASVLAVQELSTATTAIDQQQVVTVSSATHSAVSPLNSGSFKLSLDLRQLKNQPATGTNVQPLSDAIAYNAPAMRGENEDYAGWHSGSSMQAKLEKMLADHKIKVEVSRSGKPKHASGDNVFAWTVTFLNAPFDVPLMKVQDLNLLGTGVGVSVNRRVSSNFISGNFYLGLGDSKTHALRHDSDAATVRSALDSLPSVGTVAVSRSAPSIVDSYTWTVTFFGLAGDVPPLDMDGSTLSCSYCGAYVNQSAASRVWDGDQRKPGEVVRVDVKTEWQGKGVAQLQEIRQDMQHVDEVQLVRTHGGSSCADIFAEGDCTS